jgi:hypothetical protein
MNKNSTIYLEKLFIQIIYIMPQLETQNKSTKIELSQITPTRGGGNLTLKQHKRICWPEFELLFIYPMECGRERKKEANFLNQPLSY